MDSMNLKVEGVKNFYAPGDKISCCLTIPGSKTITSSELYVVRHRMVWDEIEGNLQMKGMKEEYNIVTEDVGSILPDIEFILPEKMENSCYTRGTYKLERSVYTNVYYIHVKVGTNDGECYERIIPFNVEYNTPQNQSSLTSSVLTVSGRGSIMSSFRAMDHLFIMVRCDSTSFHSGETFGVQVAMIKKSNKVFLGAPELIYRQNSTIGGSSYNCMSVKAKSEGNTRSVKWTKGVDVEGTLKRILDMNAGTRYVVKIPSFELASENSDEFSKSGVDSRVLYFSPYYGSTIEIPLTGRFFDYNKEFSGNFPRLISVN